MHKSEGAEFFKAKIILMNIDIDKLISELEAEMIFDSSRLNDVPNKEFLTGCVCQSKIIINKLVALKNEQPEAITEDSQLL